MIKHLPEGLTPFEDCGFARYPLYPLADEAFTVACRVDGQGEPSLLVRINGEEQPPRRPDTCNGRYATFRLPGFPAGTEVAYAFQTAEEATGFFSAPICRETTLREPMGLFATDTGACLRFSGGVELRFTAGDALGIECACGADAPWKPCDQQKLPLPQGFSLTLQGQPFLCELKRLSDQALSFDSLSVLWDGAGRPVRFTQRWRWSPGHVWGTGERFDAVDQKGRGSNGRVVEKFTRQGEQTYLPIPFWMTDQGFGWYRKGSAPAALRFGPCLEVEQEPDASGKTVDTLLFGAPKAILAQFVDRTGKPALPPPWSFGVWMSANGWNSDEEVEKQLRALRRWDYPASVMVLEAWSDERTFYRWNPNGSWKDPAALVKRVRDAGLHLLLWQIPIIKYEWDGEWGAPLREDEREAIEKGYCVKNADGTPYRITENWFHNSLLLDFTNPPAVEWWFAKRQYLLEMGVEGFKTDGGEFLFGSDARLYDGTGGSAAHNLYPSQYVGAYHRFLRDNGVDGLTFSRAGFTGAQTQPVHWAGDQLSQWSELQSQLNAGLSAGLSGVLFWGFDIGGFSGDLPTAELYLRATGMACFAPVMQWHSEPRAGQFGPARDRGVCNDRSPWNLAEKLNDPSVMTIATQFARTREKLRPYLENEAKACVAENRPMMAHLCLDFADDPTARATDDEYMLGRRLLVAPVVREGEKGRLVYLPFGQWENVYTKEPYEGGGAYWIDCGLERVPVFLRKGARRDAR